MVPAAVPAAAGDPGLSAQVNQKDKVKFSTPQDDLSVAVDMSRTWWVRPQDRASDRSTSDPGVH